MDGTGACTVTLAGVDGGTEQGRDAGRSSPGRSGVAVAGATPSVIYAFTEAVANLVKLWQKYDPFPSVTNKK